ncbi:MAG: hypothetical protein LBU51_00570, partial [Bacteroidales bacterium]|nr:hypothetical protein [Bacteroidales bacterium]
QISKEIETASYFKFYELHNYLYKGKEIWNEAHKECRNLEKSLLLEKIDHFNGSGTVCVANNGYGIFSFLFAMVHPNLRIVATEQDPEKVAIAQHCTGLPSNISIYVTSELPEDLLFDYIITL